MFLLHKRLKHNNLRLKYWNKNDFGNIFVDKKYVENKIQGLNQALITEGFDKFKSDQVDNHHQELENLCKQEEIFWRQKSRVQWLKEGEHNTIFFHRSTMANRVHNIISLIKDEGYILNIVEDSRLNKTILKVLNTSFISLIHKQDITQTPDKYTPIALCNVVYKIISKVVANRLKPLLPSLVSGEQSGYVEGRKILNNIIQAHEVVHSLTSKRQAGMIMQLDIGKAYDKVN
eukprot:PITA_27155